MVAASLHFWGLLWDEELKWERWGSSKAPPALALSLYINRPHSWLLLNFVSTNLLRIKLIFISWGLR